MDYLQLASFAVNFGARIAKLWNSVSTNGDFVSAIQHELPELGKLAQDIADQYFPNAADEVKIAVGATLAFNQQLVKYAQQACNTILHLDPPLEVDGWYGPKTKAAVEQLQKQLGLTADGWFGKLTEAAVKKVIPQMQPSEAAS